jgi:hypothetical protein
MNLRRKKEGEKLKVKRHVKKPDIGKIGTIKMD